MGSCTPSTSVCVSIKNRSRQRVDGSELQLFPNCVRSLARAARDCGNVELIVADFRSDDWPLAEWLIPAADGLVHHVIAVDGPFSKGKGLNVAAGAARGERLCFLDADMLIDGATLRRAIEIVDSGRIWMPICLHYDLKGAPDFWGDYGVGNLAFHRRLWELARPVPEFQSWGGEDNIFVERMLAHSPALRERSPGLIHQWHPESWRHIHYARPARSDYHSLFARADR
jgi:glycosyltransferase involved in cell wall biosynthesis